MRKLFYILAYLAGGLSAMAQLTATVTPGYTLAPGEFPTTATLNLLAQPTVTISGTVSGSTGLSAKSVTGALLADSVADGITLDYNAGTPRQLEIKTAGVSQTQLAAASVGTSQIIDANVTTAKIAAAAVDTTKLSFGMPGMVVAWAASTVPTGWLECDGSAVARAGTYNALFLIIGTTWGVGDGSTTFNLPDLRGEFVRGWIHGKTLAPETGRAFANHENDTLIDHTHSIPADYVHSGAGQGLLGSGSQTSSGGVTGTVSSPNNGGVETRPRNYSLMYVIKF